MQLGDGPQVSPAAPSAPDTRQVSAAIEKTLWELHQLELTLESFKEENQLLLLERMYAQPKPYSLLASAERACD